ncbi:hypothetical protein [Alkalihalobacillus sp. R86527]|uniref:hypothetical protein n=1 Tax=Alkalihalobacillus sp. R86527 TaxID=3093863 RepID=UPI00366C1FE9
MGKALFCTALIFLLVSCNVSVSVDDEHLGTLSHEKESGQEKMFKEMNMGILLTYNLRLTKADETWVNVWVEGYQDGKPMSPSKLTELSYGFAMNEVEEGNMGFGIIQPAEGEELFSLYAPGIASAPRRISNNPLDSEKPYGWGYTMDDEITLESGETKVIGAYYQSGKKDEIRSVDLKTEEGIERMITDENVVLLLKMKVEQRDPEN